LGGYLLPIVDKAATFFMDKLLPAFSDIGSMLGAIVVPAFKAITAVVGTVADIFNALPGPLKAGALALGAFLLLRGPLTSLFHGHR
jgi:ABC-type phosphate transport system permease subunit